MPFFFFLRVCMVVCVINTTNQKTSAKQLCAHNITHDKTHAQNNCNYAFNFSCFPRACVCVWFVCVIINTTYQKTSGKQFFGEKKHLKLFWRTKHKTENKNQADIFHFSRGPFTLLSYVSSFPSSISFPKSENKSTCPEKVNLLHLLQHDGFVDGKCEIRKMD